MMVGHLTRQLIGGLNMASLLHVSDLCARLLLRNFIAMFTVCASVLLLLVVNEGASWHGMHDKGKDLEREATQCPNLRPPLHGTVSCHHHGTRVPCHRKILVGTVADYECDTNFLAEPTNIMECLGNGTWSSQVPSCVPDCGKQSSYVTLVMNGAVATPGAYPWQVAIYNYLDEKYEFWCGGSLISEFLVITAAHCTWKIPANNLIAAFGKFFRDFNATESNVQKIRIVRVEMLGSYQDVGGNYNGDLSVIFLERAVKIDPTVRPICIDWSQEFMERQLVQGNLGTVLGWGLTENDTFSEVLKSVQLPVKSDESCISQLQRDFRKFVTYTSFCAGFRNGSGVCNGDSGGGLAFFEESSNTWYLQGVVSISPRRRGSSFCDPNFYTVFTKVTVFMKWLLKMKEVEKEFVNLGMVHVNGNDSLLNEIPMDTSAKLQVFPLDKN